jgi:hypothetical protein
MKIKTSELKDAFLDWAVGKCEYMRHSLESDFCGRVGYAWDYSTNWAKGGPIIEREGIALLPPELAEMPGYEGRGETLLIAAMRCYVTSKLGDEVDVPEELAA